MQTSMSTIRTLKDELLEEYEPMTSLYWKKNKKPNIDIRVSPFAMDRQFEDQKFSMMHNRNPRGFELTKGQKKRSETFVKQADPSALNTKAKVINKIVREVSGVHTYALVPPLVKKGKRTKQVVDPDTHPMMKPYRDESTRNPVMCSFGHRPKSASRTFHPSTMNFRLRHEEVAAVAGKGQNGFGLQPAVLSKLLHAPPLNSQQGGGDGDSQASTRPPSGWEDPHNLFLPSASTAASSGFGSTTASENAFNKSAASVSVSEGGDSGPLGHGGVLEHSRSWNTTSFTAEDEDFNGTTSFAQNSARRRKKKSKKKKMLDIEKDNRLDASGWNNHFQVIERPSNENFELRKSGIAELKLMPLKERLTRYASLSVQESRPDPFCAEKKQTDALLLSGFTGSTREVFDRQENPYYDAEVDEDVRIIQGNHDRLQEKKMKQLQRKKFVADMKTIPKCNYHPDQSVLNMHQMSDEEMAMKQSEKASNSEVGFQSVGDLYNTLSPPKKDPKEDKKSRQTSKSSSRRKRGNVMEEKIRSFSHIYVGGDDLGPDISVLSLSSSDRHKTKKNVKKASKPKYNIDKVFDHVMQPFDAYLQDDSEYYEDGEGPLISETELEPEEKKEEKEEEKQQQQQGTDIADMLQKQEEEGLKRGFHNDEYDYINMRNDADLHYNEDDDEGAGEHYHEQEEHQEEHQDRVEEEEGDEEQEQEDDKDVNTFVNQQYHDNKNMEVMDKDKEKKKKKEEEEEEEKEKEEEKEEIKEKEEEREPGEKRENMNDCDDEEDTFVNQQYDEHEEGDENEDDLDNPHVGGEQEYVEQDEEGGQGQDFTGHDYEHEYEEGEGYENEYEDGGSYGQGLEQGDDEEEAGEDQENYDDQKLDFANEELGEDGMFTENQY